MKIEIRYNGAYPNLCSGDLVVIIDDTEWEFPDYCLCSGGSVWFDDEWNENVESGEWEITKWPENFPEEYKPWVLSAVNEDIPHGCCGGCV